jgi:hypothetical protein
LFEKRWCHRIQRNGRIGRPRSLLRQWLIRAARRCVRDSAYPDLPLHITKYNTSSSPRSPIHHTALHAPYLGRQLSRGGGLADAFSYWTFAALSGAPDSTQVTWCAAEMALHLSRKVESTAPADALCDFTQGQCRTVQQREGLL